jgi:hypothetical protein
MGKLWRLSKSNWSSSWIGCSENRKRTPINLSGCDNTPSRRGTNGASIACSHTRDL